MTYIAALIVLLRGLWLLCNDAPIYQVIVARVNNLLHDYSIELVVVPVNNQLLNKKIFKAVVVAFNY